MTAPLIHTCCRCGHTWEARVVRPKKCPSPACQSPYWWIARGLLKQGNPSPGRLRAAPDPTSVKRAKRRSLFCETCDDLTQHELTPNGPRCTICTQGA